jgi:hypothetical protein
MIVSKEPNHSLGGYSYREHWSRTQQKEKKRKQFFMQDITMIERQGVNIFESIPEFFLTIARGLFPSGALIAHPTNMKSSDI